MLATGDVCTPLPFEGAVRQDVTWLAVVQGTNTPPLRQPSPAVGLLLMMMITTARVPVTAAAAAAAAATSPDYSLCAPTESLSVTAVECCMTWILSQFPGKYLT